MITAKEARGNSRLVTVDEYRGIAETGRRIIRQRHARASAPSALTGDWLALARRLYESCQTSWGGLTVDSHTGQDVTAGYAVSAKLYGQPSVSVREDATWLDFAEALGKARTRFRKALRAQGAALGVFHDDDEHRIDIDPVLIVYTQSEAEAVGAAAHAVGGAYCFADGNGYFPPHVADGTTLGEAS